MGQAFPAPTFGHAAEAFLIAHAAPGAWSAGTAVKYRQTLTALGGQLDGAGQAAASDVAVLGTPAGASALEAAFTAAFGQLAPATRADPSGPGPDPGESSDLPARLIRVPGTWAHGSYEYPGYGDLQPASCSATLWPRKDR